MVNPVLERLGFPADARVVIVHADDLGMCHAANVAFWEDQAFGIVTCGAVMMPCSWAPEMAAWCRANPRADVGVHITLTSGHDVYRWGPLSTRDSESGLIDDQGYMWRSVEELYRHMDCAAVVAEIRAQIEMALAMGIDVTHIDMHTGAVIHPQLLPAYVALALEYRIPAMLPHIPEERIVEWGVDPELGKSFLSRTEELRKSGFPILDMILAARDQGDHLEVYKRLFDEVPVGVTHLLLHPAVPGYDIEPIAPSAAAYRIADYETFLRPELKAYVTGQGIQLIGYRRLRELMR